MFRKFENQTPFLIGEGLGIGLFQSFPPFGEREGGFFYIFTPCGAFWFGGLVPCKLRIYTITLFIWVLFN